MARSRGLLAVAVVFVIALVAGACGTSNAKYVKNSDLGIYLKVPNNWTVFTLEDGGPAILPTYVDNKPTVLKWWVGFDSSPTATRTDLERIALRSPNGSIQVIPSPALGLPGHGNTDLRAIVTGRKLDSPTNNYGPLPDGVEISDDKDVEFNSGYFGVQLTVKQPGGTTPEGTTVFVKHTNLAYFDSTTYLFYLLQVGCEADCYDRNQTQIN